MRHVSDEREHCETKEEIAEEKVAEEEAEEEVVGGNRNGGTVAETAKSQSIAWRMQ